MFIGIAVCILHQFACIHCLTSVTGFLLLRWFMDFQQDFHLPEQPLICRTLFRTHKRGEAMGLLGTAGTVGMAAGLASDQALPMTLDWTLCFMLFGYG
jgi:hypothetical protein